MKKVETSIVLSLVALQAISTFIILVLKHIMRCWDDTWMKVRYIIYGTHDIHSLSCILSHYDLVVRLFCIHYILNITELLKHLEIPILCLLETWHWMCSYRTAEWIRDMRCHYVRPAFLSLDLSLTNTHSNGKSTTPHA